MTSDSQQSHGIIVTRASLLMQQPLTATITVVQKRKRASEYLHNVYSEMYTINKLAINVTCSSDYKKTLTHGFFYSKISIFILMIYVRHTIFFTLYFL